MGLELVHWIVEAEWWFHSIFWI